jgi:endoglucanase
VIIDIFVDSRAEAEKLVQIGNPAILNTQPPKIAKNKIVGAGLDNSVSVYACLEMAKQLDKVPIDNNIIIHFSRREETGGLKFINMMRDVSEIPNKIDYIFVVDTEIATDVPALQLDEMTDIRINLGPVISRNLVDDTMLSYQCQDLADKNKIKYQLVMSSMPGAANNLGNYNAMNSIGQSIGVPLRNMHSGVEVVSLGDIERTIDLIIVLAKELK